MEMSMETSTTDLQFRCSSTEMIPQVPKQVFIQRLPMEIQVLIVKACVVANPAVIKVEKLSSAANGKLIHTKVTQNDLLVEEEQPLQANMALGILQSCHFYREEGLKVFWQENRFLLGLGAVRSPLCGPVPWSRQAAMLLKHLKHNFYADRQDRQEQLGDTLLACINMEQFPSLESLELELGSLIPYPRPLGHVIRKNAMLSARHFYERFRQSLLWGPAITGRRLKHVTVTDIPLGIRGCLMVRILSTLLEEGGTIEAGMEDARYGDGYLSIATTQPFIPEEIRKPKVQKMKLENVDGWINNLVQNEDDIPTWWTWYV